MTTLVYPVGHGRGDLLRYSLRSVAAAAGSDLPTVVLIGERPDYIDPGTVVFLESSQAYSPFRNVWTAWQRAAQYLGGTHEFWWMNDDFLIAAGRLDDALTDAHRGPLSAFVRSLDGRGGIGPWRRRARATLGLLSAAMHPNPMCWETHRPMRATGLDVVRAVAALDRYRMDGAEVAQRTLIATLAGRVGEHLPDPKVDTAHPAPMPMPLVSTGPRAWAGTIGEELRGMFPAPSPWETVTAPVVRAVR